MNITDKFPSWLAVPLTDEAKSAKFRETMSQHAERQLYGHAAIRSGWAVGITGAVCILASVWGWCEILVNWPQPEVRFYVVDRTSGYVGPATTAKGAPALFSEATDHEHLQRYIAAREGWVAEDDRSNDYLVKLMSRRDEQERYAAWRKLPTSPLNAIGKNGHVETHNYRWHPLCGTPGTERCGAKSDLKRYLVQFDRVVWLSGASGTKGWSATVDFEYHPELPMKPTDRDLNSAGFQVIAYSADPDA